MPPNESGVPVRKSKVPAWLVRQRPPGVLVVALVVVVILWGLLLSIFDEQKTQTFARQSRYTNLLASGVAEGVSRTLFDAQSIAKNISRRLEGEGVPTALGPLPDIISEWYAGIGAIMVFDSEGQVAYATRDSPRTGAAQVRRWLENARGLSQPAIEKLEFDGDKRSWFLPVIARYESRAGKGSGVVVVIVSARSFLRPFAAPEAWVPVREQVIGPEGIVWAQLVAGQESEAGQDVSRSLGYQLMVSTNKGVGILRVAVDGVERLDSFARIPGTTAWAVAGAPVSDVLEPWEATRRGYVAFGAATSALIIALAAWGSSSFARERAHSRLIAKARDEAEAASRLKSEFVTTMSHELRTPLSSIVGYAELLAGREFDAEKRREFARAMLAAARHLTNVLSDILDISKIEAGKMQIHLADTPLKALIEGCVDVQRQVATSKQLDLRLTVAPDVPDRVRTDPTRLTQILTNLLGNAVKFTDAGFVSLSVARAGDALEFRVADSGPGIAPQFQATMFERFRQGDPALAIKHGGTGLGLPLVRALAEMLGGDVRVESAAGQGATFIVTLPIVALAVEGEIAD